MVSAPKTSRGPLLTVSRCLSAVVFTSLVCFSALLNLDVGGVTLKELRMGPVRSPRLIRLKFK
jgi:hypothetical protein